MAKAVKTVGAILVVGGLALATGGAALIPAVAGGGLAGALGTAIGGITAGQLITVGTILQSVGSTPKVGAGGNPTQWKIDPDAGIPFAVGRVGVAGTIVYRREFGPENMYQGVVSVLSGAGPINAFVSFSASDEAVAFDGSGKATTSQYSGELFTQTRLGTSSQTYMVQGGLKNGSTLPGWGSSHRLLGKAARMLTLAENSKGTAFPNGEPEPLDVLQGILYWDPRLDSTYPGGSGSCRLDNPATWVYGTNPIIHALKWWLGYFENGKQVGGVGISRDAIDIPAFVDAANVADANGWIISAYPTTKDDKHQVGIAMLQAGGAVYASVGGKVSCISRGAPRASLLTVNGNDTAGPVEIDTAATRVSRINTIIPRFWSEAHRWQMTAGSPVGFSGYIDQDRGNTRIRPVDYPYVPQALQAAQLAGFDIVDSREGIVGVVPFKPHMRRLKPGMAFTFTEPGFVLSGLKCLVLNREYNPADGVVKITFRSETDAKYDLALGRTTTVPPPPALTPPDPTVEAPDNGDWIITPRLPGEDGVEVPIVDVVGEVTSATATQVHFEWAPTSTGPWTSLGLWPPTTTKLPIDGLQPGQVFYVAVSNVRGQNYSDRTIKGPYTAPGLRAGDVIPTAPSLVAIDDRIDDAFGELAGVEGDLAAAEALIEAQGLEIAAARGGQPNLGARIVQVNDASVARDATNATAITLVEAKREVLALAVGNNDFSQGVEGWSNTTVNDPAAPPIPTSAWIPQATFEGLSGVLVPAQATGVSGDNRLLAERRRWAIDPSRKYQIRARLHVGSAGSGTSIVYIGGQMMDGAGAAAGANSGRRYFAVNATAYSPGAGVVEVLSPVITGTGGTLTNFDPATKLLSLLFYQNWGNNPSAPPIAIDELVLLDVTDRETAAAAVLNVQSALVTEETIRASQIAQVSARLARAPLANVPFDSLGTGYFASSTSTDTGQVAGAPEGRSNPAQFASMNSTANGWVSRFNSARRVLTQAVLPLPVGRVIEVVTEWNVTTAPSGSAGTGRFTMIGLNGDFTYFANDTSPNFSFPAGTTGRVTHRSRWARSGHGLAGVNSVSGAPVNVRPAVDVTTFNGMVADLVGVSVLDVTEEAGLQATVTQQSLALVDLETQQALAKFEVVAAASGGLPARLRLVSSSLGSAISLDAPFIFFGPNTTLDTTTNTEQTIVGPLKRVIAKGAPFGAASNLLEWWGPNEVALSDMTTANGYNGRFTATPFVFDNALVPSAAGGASLGRSDIGGVISSSTWTTIASVAFSSRPAAGWWDPTINMAGVSDGSVETDLEVRVIESGASTALASASLTVPAGSVAVSLPAFLSPSGPYAQTRPPGSISLLLQARRPGGTGVANLEGAFFASHTPAAS